MPLDSNDIDLLGKLIAQLVHDEFEKRSSGSDELEKLRKENESLLETLEEQSESISMLKTDLKYTTEALKSTGEGLEQLGEAVRSLPVHPTVEDVTASVLEALPAPPDEAAITERVLESLPEPAQGPAGPQGEAGPPGEKGEDGKDGKEFSEDEVSSMVRQHVRSAVMAEIGDVVKDQLPALIPDPIEGPAGPQGEKGEDGKDGKDATEIDWNKVAQLIEVDVKRLMPDPIAPNVLMVKEALTTLWPTIRSDVLKSLPAIEHKGVYDPHQTYFPGDEVIKGDSTFRAKYETNNPPPGDDWQCIAKSRVGRRGADGKEGPQGKAGADGKDAAEITAGVWQDDQIVLTKSDGNVILIQLEDQRTNEGEEDGTSS